MSQKVTIGGDRVGSGKKMQAELHDYYRSTHNLSEKFATSMASGVLIPAMCKLAMRGDTFDINIAADARTIPTVAPLFGSYKMQIDVYQCPVRLYQGILHNNPLAIGLNMGQVKFPTLHVWTQNDPGEYGKAGKLSDNCLLAYLGMRGLGFSSIQQSRNSFGRIINALPILSYYDIFKTYYANKQEDNAYVIIPGETSTIDEPLIKKLYRTTTNREITNINAPIEINTNYYGESFLLKYEGTDFSKISIELAYTYTYVAEGETQTSTDSTTETIEDMTSSYGTTGGKITQITNNNYNWDLYLNLGILKNYLLQVAGMSADDNANITNLQITFKNTDTNYKYTTNIHLEPFPLSNIDDMRYDLLGHHELGTAFEIKPRQAGDPDEAYLPYSALININATTGKSWNTYAMNGLVLKTYQNDMFNNWLNSEWIEGENGINELTKVAVVDGAFSMDALNMSMKLYNMLNRIALAGGTYEDWQDVVYEEVQRRQIESPIYVGGMAQEIMFDEIIQTTPTEGSPLGTLGGRGKLVGDRKGGRIHVKCDEACFIIAIVSLTPRLFYTQGNEFYMTDIFSMDDLHKPAMDGIGFQDLIGERMAYFDTVVRTNTTSVYHRSKIGKLPAWIEYMTSYDRAYGDFAGEYGKGFMTLNRNYEQDEDGSIKDATTYIDPSKYNYAFAVQELAAQNFWVEINFDIKARRLMSARLIPNV